jgi:hypothetical protein
MTIPLRTTLMRLLLGALLIGTLALLGMYGKAPARLSSMEAAADGATIAKGVSSFKELS